MCDCVPKDMYSIQALFQTSFDGELVHFKMVCLFCDHNSKIKENLDNCARLAQVEKDIFQSLEEGAFPFLLQLTFEGKTYPFHLTSGEP